MPLSSRPTWRSALWAALAVALLLGGAWAYARLQSPHPFYGTAYPAGTPAAALSGTGDDGRPFDLSALRGQTVAVFFGFLSCPNICPTTLASLERVRQALPATARGGFRTVLVTLDPDRDDARKLRTYVRYFGPAATGVRIEEPALAATAAAWGVGYQRAPAGKGGAYEINHTTGVYLIDRAGQLRVVWDYSQLTRLERVVADVRAVLR